MEHRKFGKLKKKGCWLTTYGCFAISNPLLFLLSFGGNFVHIIIDMFH